eukprot:Lithocolla_globosa_v1_NODE_5986_length_1153_cov_12.128415.p1 type:complete len:347 gc:universal NODE_5986_length_1153_cov_12.128415:1093-53(-)
MTNRIVRPLVALIEADGIGREVVPACRQVLEAAGSPFDYIPLEAGFELFEKKGTSLPDETVDALKNKCDASIFGAVSSPSVKVEGYSSPIVKMRKLLDLYANVRPVVNKEAVKPIDMVIFRENTECLYVKEEEVVLLPDGTKKATAVRVITEKASKRIATKAFETAKQRLEQRGNATVTIVHKSNVLSLSDGVFRESCLAVSQLPEFKGIQVNEQLVDSMVYRLFREPHCFDVVVAPNMYGDIISDGAAALVGSLGLVPSVNWGPSHIMAEPVHGSAPDIAGKGIANPIACIRSGAMLLEAFGHLDKARKINQAVEKTLGAGILTPDLGGKATTEQVVSSIISHLD